MKFSIFNWKRTITSEENKSIQPKPLRFFTDDFNRLLLGAHCFYVDEKSVQECFPQSVLKMKIRSSCFFYCIFLLWALLTQVYYFYILSQLLTKPWLSALTAMRRHFHFWFLAYVALNIACPCAPVTPEKWLCQQYNSGIVPQEWPGHETLCQYADVTRLIEQ